MRLFILVSTIGITLATLLTQPAMAEARTLTTSTGYRLDYDVRGQESSGPIALIIMHGKNFPAEATLHRFAAWGERVAQAGFRVYTPVMPWSARWDGAHEDATSALDALVELAAKDGKKIIVGGHSMGAMFTVLYRASALPPAIIGKFVSAPGHMLDMIPTSSSFWSDINPSLRRAKSLEADGKGKEKSQFDGRNTAGSQNITESYTMTPEVYLSWHDPQRLPKHAGALQMTSVPVLWTIGGNDPLVLSNASESTFKLMPSNPKSSFVLLGGKDHSTSFLASTELLIPWMKSLVAQ
jgi:pimeloyl-ACP methyl ester carboxylesterase